MEKGLNFKSIDSQNRYFEVYEESLNLISTPHTSKYIATSFGQSHVVCCGDEEKPPLVLLHAASCGSPIWYPNIPFWSQNYRIYAVDLIGETSKSVLTRKLKSPSDHATWLNETLNGLDLDKIALCGLSIGAWAATNYALFFADRIAKLILLSPVQTFAKMYASYFLKIMKMGFHPTRENVERYIGWGGEQESPLPDSIIEQFTLSVTNMNSNISFPRFIRRKKLNTLTMPVLLLFGANEFAFSVTKAIRRAKRIRNLDCEIVPNASHLISVSQSAYVNQRVLDFIQA